MDTARFARLQDLYHGARDLPPEQRLAFLERETGEDRDLRDDVLRLLKDPLPGAWAAPEHPEQIGDYRILRFLGEGAMGAVYLAERRTEIRQQLALKVVKPGMDTKEVLARFDVERQALAVMNHDAIARVFDAGRTASGQPYFVMEYVEGVPLTSYCDEHRLSMTDRIRLVQEICAGVHHAHQKGVLHRDLKPGNILVARREQAHVPKIIDFGLARATNRQLVQQTVFTEQGRMLGTPEYMSPEQALGNDRRIDTRTDIYSLGAILYELLSGHLPFPSHFLRGMSLPEIQRVIREIDPPAPSKCIRRQDAESELVARCRRTSSTALLRDLHRDLDWIVLKALSKEPERRYASAMELAQDLDNHLRGVPVVARPPSALYRMGRFARRYRIQVAAALLVVLVTLAGLTSSLWFAFEAQGLAADYAQLLVGAEIDAFEERAAAATPAWPEKAMELQEILRLGEELVPHRAALEALLERMRSACGDALPPIPVARDRSRGPHAEQHLHDRLQVQRAFLLEHLTDPSASERAKAAGRAELTSLTGEIAAVERRIQESHRVRLADPEDQFLYDLLEGQACRLRHVEQHTLPDLVLRLRWAEAIREASVERHRSRWDDTIADLAAGDRYGRLQLEPQIGLVPLGKDPDSGLHEFAHLLSGEIPERDENGRLVIGADSCLVFVLLPPGRLRFGFASRPGEDDDGLVRFPECFVAPFFLSKYEMSRAQWERLAQGTRGLRLLDCSILDVRNRYDQPEKPVNLVSCTACETLLRRHGLQLPSEVEWEYACKAGTETRYFTGDGPDGLAGLVNLHGRADGFPGLAAVHEPKLGANPFGLHQIVGNVMEWCRFGDGQTSPWRGLRGASWLTDLSQCHSTWRNRAVPDDSAREAGLRPARQVH